MTRRLTLSFAGYCDTPADSLIRRLINSDLLANSLVRRLIYSDLQANSLVRRLVVYARPCVAVRVHALRDWNGDA